MGYALISDTLGNLKTLENTGLRLSHNVKQIKKIVIHGKEYLLIANNNGPVEFLKIK